MSETTSEAANETTRPAFGTTDSAAKRIAVLFDQKAPVDQEARAGPMRRVSVSGGRCSFSI